jgi:hypothetical protein
VALMNARVKLVAHYHVVAERLGEGWKPWSAHDVDMLVHVGGAIAVFDRLIKEEPTVGSDQAMDSFAEFVNTSSDSPAHLIGA